MPRALSATAFRELFAQESADAFLVCLTITHPSLGAPIRVVYNNQPVVRAAGTFQPALFEITLPEDTQERIPEIQLSIDNVDRSITDALTTITSRAKIQLEVVLGSNPDDIQFGPEEFDLMQIEYDAMQVTGTLSLEDDLLNSAFPSTTYIPSTSPGLFR